MEYVTIVVFGGLGVVIIANAWWRKRKGDEALPFQWLDKAMQGGFDVYGYLDDSDLDSVQVDDGHRLDAAEPQHRPRAVGKLLDIIVAPQSTVVEDKPLSGSAGIMKSGA